MRCPVCDEHKNSTQDNHNIFFNGACTECLENKSFYYQSEGSIDEVLINDCVDNGLTLRDKSYLKRR
jgi:hypothetical protein